MTQPATLAVTEEEEISVATLTGDIDLEATEEIAPEVLAAVNKPGGLVLDLSGVTFLDSSGLRMIFGARRRLARRQRRLAVVLPRNERVRQVFALVDASETLELFWEPDDALAYCRGDVDR